jgi:N-acetylmuramoyl-L-alanine amidase
MLRVLVVLAALLVLSGCTAPAPIKHELPPPLLHTPGRPAPLPAPPIPKAPPAPRTPTLRTLNGTIIVVDPGHGGHDPGARGLSAVAEESINLNVAMRLARLLEERGAKVITTRNSDRFISLDDRAALADRTRADLFVSVHADSSRRPGVSGATVYISRNAAGSSREAARSIVAALEQAGIECRGVQRAGFRVLVGHSRPAVLIECGFLTNRADAARLNSSSYQDRLAAAITAGLAEYFSR